MRLALVCALVALSALLATPCVAQTPDPQQWELVDDMWLPKGAWGGGRHSTFIATPWTASIVPYAFNANVNQLNRERAIEAMGVWAAVSALTFVERTNQANYIVFNSHPSSNNSFVGMIGGPQTINVVSWHSRYTIVHEVGHAVGLLHEQSRPDRDTFVQINSANITAGFAHNFNIAPTSTTFGAYDFDSCMHYGQNFFSNNGMPTITVLPPNQAQQNQIGQRQHISILDGLGMGLRYGAAIAPTISEVFPCDITQGESGTLRILGERFQPSGFDGMGVPGSVIHINGSPVTATFVNPFELTAPFTAAMTAGSTLTITVENPAPGAGHSLPYVETIHAPAAPTWPGSGEDLVLMSAIGADCEFRGSGFGLDHRQVGPGDLLRLHVDSPGGAFDFLGLNIVANAYTTGMPPTSFPGFPELHLSASQVVYLMRGTAQGPLGPTGLLLPSGITRAWFIPSGLAGNSLLVQAYVRSGAATNGIFAITDGLQIEFN